METPPDILTVVQLETQPVNVYTTQQRGLMPTPTKRFIVVNIRGLPIQVYMEAPPGNLKRFYIAPEGTNLFADTGKQLVVTMSRNRSFLPAVELAAIVESSSSLDEIYDKLLAHYEVDRTK